MLLEELLTDPRVISTYVITDRVTALYEKAGWFDNLAALKIKTGKYKDAGLILEFLPFLLPDKVILHIKTGSVQHTHFSANANAETF